jgi:hypothetical protein
MKIPRQLFVAPMRYILRLRSYLMKKLDSLCPVSYLLGITISFTSSPYKIIHDCNWCMNLLHAWYKMEEEYLTIGSIVSEQNQIIIRLSLRFLSSILSKSEGLSSLKSLRADHLLSFNPNNQQFNVCMSNIKKDNWSVPWGEDLVISPIAYSLHYY